MKTEDANKYAAHNFSDVDASGWCASQGWLRLALVNGYMEGFKNGDGTGYTHTFGPTVNLTRAQAAVILYRMAFPDSTDTLNKADYAQANTTGLPDVEAGTWYTAAVNWAQEAGIVTGYKDEKTGEYVAFGPNDNVTREQLAAMIGRLCVDYAGMTPVAEDDVATRVAAFPDGASISSWAYDGVAFCAENGIITGYAKSGEFGPADNATREQMAKITVATASMAYGGAQDEGELGAQADVGAGVGDLVPAASGELAAT